MKDNKPNPNLAKVYQVSYLEELTATQSKSGQVIIDSFSNKDTYFVLLSARFKKLKYHYGKWTGMIG